MEEAKSLIRRRGEPFELSGTIIIEFDIGHLRVVEEVYYAGQAAKAGVLGDRRHHLPESYYNLQRVQTEMVWRYALEISQALLDNVLLGARKEVLLGKLWQSEARVGRGHEFVIQLLS